VVRSSCPSSQPCPRESCSLGAERERNLVAAGSLDAQPKDSRKEIQMFASAFFALCFVFF